MWFESHFDYLRHARQNGVLFVWMLLVAADVKIGGFLEFRIVNSREPFFHEVR